MMFGDTGGSTSSSSRPKGKIPFRARELWVVALAAVLVSLSFFWETAYEFKHAYYIDTDTSSWDLTDNWHKPSMPVLGDFNQQGDIQLVYAKKNRISVVEYEEDRSDAAVLSTFDLPADHSVLAIVAPPGGLTKQQPYIVVVSATEPEIKAIVDSGLEAGDESKSAQEPTLGEAEKENVSTEKFSNFEARKAVATMLTFTCFQLPKISDSRVWQTKVPFTVELNNMWDFVDPNLEMSPEEKKRWERSLMKPFHFEATGFMAPSVALHKGDHAGAVIVAVSVDDSREPYLFALDMSAGHLRWKQHVDTEETLQEDKPEKEANVDDGAGGYKAAYDHSYKFEAVVRESEQSAHMQEIHWRQFKKDVLRFQSSYDGSFGSVLPHAFYTLEGIMSPNLIPVFLDDQDYAFHRIGLFAGKFSPPGKQSSKRLDMWQEDYANPNVIVLHHRYGVSVIHLYTGRVLTYLPTQVNRMYADLDGTGTVDALMLDPEERVVEVQDAFNGISFAGLRQSHRFNASLDDSHIPPLEAIMLSMRHAAVDHDSKEDDFRAEILTPPVAIHPEVKNRIFGEAILGDFDEMKQVSLAGVKLGSGAPAAEDRKKTTGWTTVTMDGRGEIIAVSHQGRVVFRLLTDASWRPHSDHSTVDHLPALYGFCLHDQRHCSPERWDSLVAVGFDSVVIVSGGKILASTTLPLIKRSELRDENQAAPKRMQPSVVHVVGGDINNDGTNDVILVLDHLYLGLLLESSSASFFPVMVGSFVLVLVGMLIFRTYGVGGQAPSIHD